MKSRKSFLLRMDPHLHEALEAWAEQELRSLNGQIEFILKDAVNRRRRTLPGAEEAKKPSSSGDES
jgi:hypothetical protein